MSEFVIFAIIGFCAQIIDGALGMGFGIISSSVLLGLGVPPALASASVNAAKIPTTGTAALSHLFHRNIDVQLVTALCIFGGIGGAIGMLLLTGLKGAWLTSIITFYLLLIGGLIVWRGIKGVAPRVLPAAWRRTIGFAGGLIEGIGGSWGPIVTTSLMGAGTPSRYAIGSTNFAEFFVAVTVFTAYFTAFLVGHWEGGTEWQSVLYPVAGLVVGGLPAAFFGGMLSKITPHKALTIMVGLLAISIGIFRLFSA
ncbi:MAG: sulfite exporter TauE/SafE family protein [Phyllobacteriaceae bacterium]|nr:sulfite exporter TauE/SafE family protein [Phyllobacteriaceae bacterium]